MTISTTYALAMAAGRDAGNANMREAGRTQWNENDYAIAAKVRNDLDPLNVQAEMHSPFCHSLAPHYKLDCNCNGKPAPATEERP